MTGVTGVTLPTRFHRIGFVFLFTFYFHCCRTVPKPCFHFGLQVTDVSSIPTFFTGLHPQGPHSKRFHTLVPFSLCSQAFHSTPFLSRQVDVQFQGVSSLHTLLHTIRHPLISRVSFPAGFPFWGEDVQSRAPEISIMTGRQ